MMTGYPYVSIMVTGCLHCFLGVTVCIISILCIDPYTKEFIAGTLISGFWMLMLGTLGIEAGVQQVEVEKIQELISMAGGLDIIVGWEKFADRKKRQLKIVYMVTSILSACVFSGLACGLHTGVIPVSSEKAKSDSYVAIGGSGIVFAILEFILAMVSSILCCCFSPTTSNTTDAFQAPPQKIVTTVPGQSTIHYQYPFGLSHRIVPATSQPTACRPNETSVRDSSLLQDYFVESIMKKNSVDESFLV